jgi:RND family efflux transporter MFP subunit
MNTHRFCLFILIGFLFMQINCGGKESVKKIPTPVKVQAAEEYQAANSTRYSSNIEPKVQVSLAFKVGGYIESLFQVRGIDGKLRDVQEGDHIKRGTVLAKIRKSDYEAKVGQAEGMLDEANASFQQASQDYARYQRLFESESVTKSDFDAVKARFDGSQSKIISAKAQLQEAKIALKDSDLVSPIDATIMQRNIESGDLANAGTVGFVVADTTSVKAVFGVPDLTIDKFKIGQPLTVILEAIPGVEFQGIISRISPAADSKTRLFETEITIPNPQDRIKSGMIATILAGKSDSVTPKLVVPLTAIVQARGKDVYAVMVVQTENGKKIAHQRSVKLGQTFGNTIAVLEGLNSGEEIITTGATLVIDGEEVSVIP